MIPWSYGVDRVRAMAVDPERLFVYWEVTDEAIQRAREELGPSGPDAWPALRVYETTGRIFDGTNAHGYFDHEVDRGERQRFFDIGKPGSEAVVELGLKSDEGHFVKIVRSGRVEFPRRGPLTTGSQQWLTVRDRAGQPQPASGPGGGAIESSNPAPWPSDDGRPAEPTGFELVPDRIEHAPGPLTESSVEEMRVHRSESGESVEYGPWEVVIHGNETYHRRTVLARWEMHRAWISEEGHEVRGVPLEEQLMAGSSARFGASERRWVAGSELRLAGASELLWPGAGERRLGGASERLMRGASERRLGGASEPRLKARGAYPRIDPDIE